MNWILQLAEVREVNKPCPDFTEEENQASGQVKGNRDSLVLEPHPTLTQSQNSNSG